MKISRYGLLLMVVPLSGRVAAQVQLYPLPISSATQAVAAITVGDFDRFHSGKELGILMADGSIVELTLGTSGWTSNTIHRYKGGFPWDGPATRVSLRVGDVLSEYAGQEIVLSYQSQVVAVYRDSGGWSNRIVADFSGLAGTSWGAEVGDCDPIHPGEEVFSIFEGVLDFSSGTVFSETNGTWNQNDVYLAEVGMDAAIGDCNPNHAGNEIIVVTEMGPAYEIMPPAAGGPGPWPKRTIWNDFDNAGWVVKIADVDPQTPGNELVYGTRYSDRILMSHHNGTNMHNVIILLTGVSTNTFSSMYDVAIGQVLPASPSAGILGVDSSGSLYLVQQVTNHWQGSILWQDTNALYAVAAADLIPSLPGDEIVVAGASGTVSLLCNPAPVLNLALTAQQQVVLSWTALKGLTYYVETTTNLASGSAWSQLTNLAFQAFVGTLSYTNIEAVPAHARFFRLRTSR
jgi:hypothetical protein